MDKILFTAVLLKPAWPDVPFCNMYFAMLCDGLRNTATSPPSVYVFLLQWAVAAPLIEKRGPFFHLRKPRQPRAQPRPAHCGGDVRAQSQGLGRLGRFHLLPLGGRAPRRKPELAPERPRAGHLASGQSQRVARPLAVQAGPVPGGSAGPAQRQRHSARGLRRSPTQTAAHGAASKEEGLPAATTLRWLVMRRRGRARPSLSLNLVTQRIPGYRSHRAGGPEGRCAALAVM